MCYFRLTSYSLVFYMSLRLECHTETRKVLLGNSTYSGLVFGGFNGFFEALG